MTRDCTSDQQKIAICVNADDDQVLCRAANIAHVTRHLLAFEDTTRRLVLTDGTRRTMRERVAMGGILH